MLENRLPASNAVAFGFAVTRLPLRGQRRVWFQLTRTRTGFPFHLLTFTIDIEKAAKHLTTSPTMLTAAKAVGKPESRRSLGASDRLRNAVVIQCKEQHFLPGLEARVSVPNIS